MRERLNLIGQKFGRLTVIKNGGLDKFNKTLFECRCDCGKEKIISGTSLVQGHTKSCGCLQKETNVKRCIGNTWCRLPPGEAGFNKLYRIYQRNAKNRDKPIYFDSSEEFKEEFRKLTKENCYYCNKGPAQISASNGPHHLEEGIKNSEYIYNGIDRLDNDPEIGYRKGNVVSCCGRHNLMKNDLNEEEFLKEIELIYNFRIKNKENKNV
jgi:hypothetical protein